MQIEEHELGLVERRYSPIGNTFLNIPPTSDNSLLRSRSWSGGSRQSTRSLISSYSDEAEQESTTQAQAQAQAPTPAHAPAHSHSQAQGAQDPDLTPRDSGCTYEGIDGPLSSQSQSQSQRSKPLADTLAHHSASERDSASSGDTTPRPDWLSSTVENNGNGSNDDNDDKDIDDEADLEKTTLIVRNIPAECTQKMLTDCWAPDGSYDIFYMPFSFKKRKNLGFAFINFVSHSNARKFCKEWQGKFLTQRRFRKPLSIGWAETQGHEAHLQQICAHTLVRIPLMSFQPVVLEGTTQLEADEYFALNERRALPL